MRYDLHLHTCLSPCADRDMTPATVAGLAKLAGAELIAVTDHNSALNLPAAEKACREYGLRLLPGLEVTTAERKWASEEANTSSPGGSRPLRSYSAASSGLRSSTAEKPASGGSMPSMAKTE